MAALIVLLIATLLNSAMILVDSAIDSLAPMAFHAEKVIGAGFSTGTVTSLYRIALNFGLYLMILKFLKKGFEAYTLWTDGDPDSDPLLLFTNFFKALAVALTFTVAYDWISDISLELLDKFLEIININTGKTTGSYITDVINMGLYDALVSLVFFIMWFMLYLQFFKRGIEMMVMRVGMPFACMGLLDSDRGVFKPYMQKFFQNAFTVIIQVALSRLGVNLLLNYHAVWGVAAMMTALSTPKFLQEFMISSGGSNMSGAIYQTARLGQMAKNVVKIPKLPIGK